MRYDVFRIKSMALGLDNNVCILYNADINTAYIYLEQKQQQDKDNWGIYYYPEMYQYQVREHIEIINLITSHGSWGDWQCSDRVFIGEWKINNKDII